MSFEEKLEEGLSALKENDFDEAMDTAKSLQKIESENPDGFHLEAMTLQKLTQWESSVNALEKAIERDPEKSGFYNLRGFAYLQMEELEKAKEDFQKAIDLDDSPAAHRNLVLYMIMNEQGQDGIEYLIGRIRKQPQDVENWILMGDLMQRGGSTAKAKSYYEQALKMDPENKYVKQQLEEI